MEPDPQASQSADPESGSPSLFSRRKTPLLLSQFHQLPENTQPEPGSSPPGENGLPYRLPSPVLPSFLTRLKLRHSGREEVKEGVEEGGGRGRKRKKAAVSVRQRGRRRDNIPGEKNSDMSGDPGRVDVTERRGKPSETPRSW
ncbi:Versican core protein [Dissostichus eleginoides]|uniref:Versican core protein n=1 Tax=Dissostichus eleginoides TaxID=100907 RepID=A0AAD9ERP3_DISEL|nr:Versican core protein [Dissostichus eleginoides]